MKKIDFLGLADSYVLSNGLIDLIVPSAIGPRVLSFSVTGGPNLLHASNFSPPLAAPLPHGGHWMNYSRFGNSPPQPADNARAGVEVEKGLFRVRQQVEEPAKIIREMEIRLFRGSSQVHITHRIFNQNAWAISLWGWSGTAFPSGGVAIIPTTSGQRTRSLQVTPPGNFGDKRLCLYSNCIAIQAPPHSEQPFEATSALVDGYAIYWRSGFLFACRPHFYDNTEQEQQVTIHSGPDYLELRSHYEARSVASGACFEFQEDWVATACPDNPLAHAESMARVINEMTFR